MTDQPQSAEPETLAPDQTAAAEPETVAPATAESFDDEDVKAALEKTDTKDGSGFADPNELPQSDFDGFAESDVEKEDDK